MESEKISLSSDIFYFPFSANGLFYRRNITISRPFLNEICERVHRRLKIWTAEINIIGSGQFTKVFKINF